MRRIMHISVILFTLSLILVGCGKDEEEDIRSSIESSIESIEPTIAVSDASNEEVTDESEETSVESTAESEQPKADTVVRGVNASDETNVLLRKSLTDINISDYSVSMLSEEMQSYVIFGMLSEQDILSCYALACEYFEVINTFKYSDWLTTVHYDDAHCQVLEINGEHYKFVISDNDIFITDEI